MPFTNPWSDTIPTDPSLANLLGADIRQLRLDIHDRMNVVFQDWTQDPLVFQNTVIGKNAGIDVNIPYVAFDTLHDNTNGFATLSNGDIKGAPVRVPNGCTIQSIAWLVSSINAPTLTASLYRRPINAVGASASVNDTTIHPGAIAIFNSSVFNHVMDPTYYYWLRLALVGNPGDSCAFYAAQLLVSRDSNDHST